MVDLNPAPSTLGLSSPVLGPWFQRGPSDSADLIQMDAPEGTLSCVRNLPPAAIWNAPAAGILSFLVASPTRPPLLAGLRQADGNPAFADGAMVLVFTLLPEVAARLGVLSQAVPRPDSASAASARQSTRPVINRIALELPVGTVTSIADLSALLPNTDSADLKQEFDNLGSDAEKAAFLGLTFSGGFGNGPRPATILRRPEKDSARLLENAAAGSVNANLWAFDLRGRPVDPGSVASIWAHLAGTLWDNLWASSDSTRQRTAAVADAKTVHLVNAHEGPLEAALKARTSGQLTNLTAIDSSDVVFAAGTNPAIGLSAAANADTDTAPLARIAPLPAGPYSPLATATPFAGWGQSNALARDFMRVALTDIERQTTGLGRDANSDQADARLRVTAARNIADPVFLPGMDEVASAVMARFAAANAKVSFIAPELDRLWGPQPKPTIGNADPFADGFENPAFSAHVLKGSGRAVGQTAEDQSIVLHFADTLPANAWVRVWPHGRDTDTGRRFRMDGGAALSDASGMALVLVPLPNGTLGDGTESVQFSFDMDVLTTAGHRYYTDMRANRPAVDAASGPVAVTAVQSGQSLFCPERGTSLAVGASAIAPGLSLVVVTGATGDGDFTALDTTSLRAEDMSASLINRADGDDRIITRDPAFVQTTQGNLATAQTTGGPERVHNSGFHKGAKAQEVYDFAAHDDTANQGVVGAMTGRTPWHEAPPAALGHAGVSAAPEIHGEGIAVSGPAADALRLLMRERRPDGIEDFIRTMGQPITNAAAAVTSAGPWTALLETAAKGTHGQMLMSLVPGSFLPGRLWDNPDPNNKGIKQTIDGVLAALPGSQTTDGLIDTTNFDDSTAAAAFDRVLNKHRKGAQGFARAALAAIGRAEDLIWLQTPALDNEMWDDGNNDIHLLAAITDRLAARPDLCCVVVVPEKHLPGRNTKLTKIRKSAIGAALKTLKNAASDRVAWCAPVAGPGRAFHMAATTLIVDDALMLTGAAHAWRRGLVFDSALSAALFDDQLTNGRPRLIEAAKRILAGNLLGVGASFVPDAPRALVKAVQEQDGGGGLGRTNPAAFTLADDPNSAAEKAIWNPATSAGTNWASLIASLAGDQRDEFENGTR